MAHADVRNAFTAAWVMQVSFDPLLLALSINPYHSSYGLLREGRAFSVNVLKKGQLELAAHYGARAGRWAASGYPCCLNPWPGLSASLVGEHPAGDHVLVVSERRIAGSFFSASKVAVGVKA